MTGLSTIVGRMDAGRVLVLGDMVADEYLMCRPDRISREAPVLILHYVDRFVRPGGATNPAFNLSRLGASSALIGVIGDDETGRELRQALESTGIDCRSLLVDPSRPTSTKTRILAKGTQEVQQQIVRIDRVDVSQVDESIRNAMIEAVCASLSNFDALLISDYENGVISPELLDACIPAARARELTIVVDSHGDLFRFKGVTAATPNQPEAAATLRRPIVSEEEIDAAGDELLAGMDAKGVLITRGSEGVALYECGAPPYKLPAAVAREAQVVDPNGAGDTVAAVFTLALLAGATMRQAAYLGNLAGGEVVRKLGTATLSREELRLAVGASSRHEPE